MSRLSLLAAAVFTLFLTANTFAQDSNPIATLTERLNPDTQVWENIQELSFQYNDHEEVILTESRVWDQDRDEWTAFASAVTEYDFFGEKSQTLTKVYNPVKDSWNEVHLTKFEQGQAKLLVWDKSSQDWQEASMKRRTTAKNSGPYSLDHTQAVTTTYDALGRPTQDMITTYTSGQIRTMRKTYTYDIAKTAALSAAANISNYPNPVRTHTTIEFSLEQASNVLIQLYDTQGRMMTKIAAEDFEAGLQQVSYDATDLLPGMYHYSLIVDGVKIASNSMIIVGR